MLFKSDIPAIALRHPVPHQTYRMVIHAAAWLVACLALFTYSAQSSAITLAEAAALPIGTQVTIEQALVINSTRMNLGGTDLIQLRDDTRALSFFAGGDGLPLDDFLANIHTGDVISFTATTLNYFGSFELTTPLSPATIVAEPTINTSIDPVPVSPQDFDDLSPTAEGLESHYVELQGIELFYGGPSINQSASAGRPVAGELFEKHTTYVARNTNGHESIIWARSQAAVDSLNARFGTIPAGPFNLPGIFLHAFDPDDALPGVPGSNYILNPVFTTLPGDLNFDGFVGIDDLNIILTAWNTHVTLGSPLQGDPSNDGFVGIDDLTLVLGHWNTGTPPATATHSTPEPGSAALFSLMATAVFFSRV